MSIPGPGTPQPGGAKVEAPLPQIEWPFPTPQIQEAAPRAIVRLSDEEFLVWSTGILYTFTDGATECLVTLGLEEEAKMADSKQVKRLFDYFVRIAEDLRA